MHAVRKVGHVAPTIPTQNHPLLYPPNLENLNSQQGWAPIFFGSVKREKLRRVRRVRHMIVKSIGWRADAKSAPTQICVGFASG